MATAKKKRTQAKKKATSPKKVTVPALEVPEPAGAVITEDVNLMTDFPKPTKFDRLYSWNKWLGWIFALQGIAILVLSVTVSLPVTTSFLTANSLAPKTLVPASHHIFDLNIAWLVAISLFVMAAAHTVLATAYRKYYESEIKQGMNRLRWVAFGASGSLMAVAIALLCGVYDFSTLLMIVALTLVTSLLGLVLEARKSDEQASSSIIYGLSVLAGVVSWVVLGMYLMSANIFGDGHIPAFVYWLYGSALVLYGGFAANFYLVRKQQGKWVDYLYGERLYMIVGLVASSALAWQIFMGTLRP